MARINKYRGRSYSRRGRGFGTKLLFTLLILIIAAGAVVGFILFETEKPQLLVDKEIKFLGGPVEIPFKGKYRLRPLIRRAVSNR